MSLPVDLIQCVGPDETGNHKTFCDFVLGGTPCAFGFMTTRQSIIDGNGVGSDEYNLHYNALKMSVIQYLALEVGVLK